MPLPRLFSPADAAKRPASLAVGLGWLLAIAALAWSGTSVTRLFATPSLPAAVEPETPTLSPAELASQLVATQGLFANQSALPAQMTSRSDAALTSVHLIGVATGFSGGRAFALIEREGRSFGLGVGDPLDDTLSDWRIASIHADRVELRAGERTHIVRLNVARSTQPTTAADNDLSPQEED